MKTVDVDDAHDSLKQLVEDVKLEREIIIVQDCHPVAKLIRFDATPGPRRAGTLKGKIHMSDDFDAPLPDFGEYQ